MDSDSLKKQILLNVGLLCINLTKDYFKENERIFNKLIRDGFDVKDNKLRLKELQNCLEIGSFVIDENSKYYKVMQIMDDDSFKTHCFVDINTGELYKPQNQNSPNKKRTFDLKQCIKISDWRGHYLKNVPD